MLTFLFLFIINILFAFIFHYSETFVPESTQSLCEQYSMEETIDMRIVEGRQEVLIKEEYIDIEEIKKSCLFDSRGTS